MGNIELYHGSLGKPAVTRDTRAGELVELSLACEFDEDGQKVTHWFKVTVWRPAAAVKNLQKGDKVLVFAGPWTEERWTGRDGEERVTLCLTAIRLEIMPGRYAEAEPSPATKPAAKPASRPTTTTARRPADDDMPF